MLDRPWAAAIAVLLALTVWTAASAADRLPNVVIILADDLGYGDVSYHGATDIRTPHIDSLAREGLRFDSFRANSNVCSPTRAALLTGRFPDRAGVPGVIRFHLENSWGRLADDVTLLPKALKPAGYRSAIVGKWHLGLNEPDTPLDRGFDVFHGFLGDMMDDYYNHLRHGENFMRRQRETITPEGHATELFTQWACDWVREQSVRPEPFLLYLAYNAPHAPIQPPEDWLQRIRERSPGLTEKRAKFVALTEHMDDGIGKLLATLKDTGIEQNTLVIFTSDNGGDMPNGASAGPFRSHKGHMYEGGLRVPCAVRWPGVVKRGSRTAFPALTMDLYATLVDLAGQPFPARIDAVSLLPTLRGETQPVPDRVQYFVRREGGVQFFGKTNDSVIRGEWKLVHNGPTSPLELFNLKSDPAEETNLAEQAPQIYREMVQELSRQTQLGGAVPWQSGRVESGASNAQ